MSLCTRSHLVQFLNSQKRSCFCSNRTSLALNTAGRRIKLYYSTDTPQNPSERMKGILKLKFPLAKSIEVVDVSGGCGSMYEIFIESVEFKGLTMVKQHRLINEILKDDIKQMHGLRISTKVPEENGIQIGETNACGVG